ncbi:hypothetical protein LTR02_017538 [Friedmanniomyces endolithicus]|nr:hypothetical protein LTR02_017538 [Friedmanniomyces endolithicus]
MAIGNWRDDGRLLQQGLMLYSRALHEDNKALRDPVQAQSDDVLATVRILGMVLIGYGMWKELKSCSNGEVQRTAQRSMDTNYLSTHCHHYFRPEAGLYGTQHASWPMATTLHYYAATGQTDSPEFETMRRILREMKSARFTSAFLVSIANHPAPPQLKAMRGTQKNSLRWPSTGGGSTKLTIERASL